MVQSRSCCQICETEYLITSFSTSVVKYIGFPVIGSSFVPIYLKKNFVVELLDIEPTTIQNTEILKNPVCISNSGRIFPECAIFLFTSQNYMLRLSIYF